MSEGITVCHQYVLYVCMLYVSYKNYSKSVKLILNTEYRIQNTEYRIQNTDYRIQLSLLYTVQHTA